MLSISAFTLLGLVVFAVACGMYCRALRKQRKRLEMQQADEEEERSQLNGSPHQESADGSA